MNHIEQLRRINDALRAVALDLGSDYSELVNCVGIINAVKARLERERLAHGLRELSEADAIDLRLKAQMTDGV
jgi:hypothetical protein